MQVLIRRGNPYFKAREVVALAIENNIDTEVQRNGLLLAKEMLLRAKSGGACLAWELPSLPARKASVFRASL